MKTDRVIFHIDMDAFFASIEVARDPSLKGKAVIVGGDPNSRGVVSTCSYEARAFGVRSAMSLSEAHRLCPHGIFLEGSYSLYSEYSHQIMDIFFQLTEKVQVVSVDEAYIDATDLSREPFSLAQFLKNAVYEKTQLTCSIGIATNKLVAKMASSAAKPNGIREIKPGEEASFLAPQPIGSLPGVGAKSQEAFNRKGILLIEDIQAMSLDTVLQEFGPWGYPLHLSAFGKDNRPVEWLESPPQSLGAETTFETDQTQISLLLEALEHLVEKACRHLHGHKMKTRAICLKIRSNDFKTITRSKGLFFDTDDVEIIKQECFEFFKSIYFGDPPLRLLGVSLHKLTGDYWQPTLWEMKA